MKTYSLYDTYETEIEPGELICTRGKVERKHT